MSNYEKLKKEIANLQAKAEEERKKEIADVVAGIKAKMAQYDITPADLGFSGRMGARRTPTKVAPKYRDPASGKTWTGRGRAPIWIQEAEKRGVKRDTFLIG